MVHWGIVYGLKWILGASEGFLDRYLNDIPWVEKQARDIEG
jgi:hypothetical protein